ncbi:MAG TPA: hypothetical protein VN709_07925 [Terriglobales bacterium]|nr:hypothetical protein [Terriglobales bacterium]
MLAAAVHAFPIRGETTYLTQRQAGPAPDGAAVQALTLAHTLTPTTRFRFYYLGPPLMRLNARADLDGDR